MTEIKRLRADLEVFERYAERQPALRHECDQIKMEIARLEAEADPWAKAKETIDRWRNFSVEAIYVDQIVPYFDYMTAENAGLKQKYDLANSTIEIATKRLNEVKAENERLTALLEDVVMAFDLPGEHCEIEQAVRAARAELDKAKGGDE